jgi:hypothetical protein
MTTTTTTTVSQDYRPMQWNGKSFRCTAQNSMFFETKTALELG